MGNPENDEPLKILRQRQGVFPFKYVYFGIFLLEIQACNFWVPRKSAVETELSGRCLRRGFKVQAFRESETRRTQIIVITGDFCLPGDSDLSIPWRSHVHIIESKHI